MNMRLIGQRLTEMHVERMEVKAGSVFGQIDTKAVPTNVRIGEGQLGDNVPLIIEYQFSSNYNLEKPKGENAAEIMIRGEVIFEAEKKESEAAVKSWKKEKQIVKDQQELVLQAVLSSSQMHAITLAKDMNLPSPIPLPRINVQKD